SATCFREALDLSKQHKTFGVLDAESADVAKRLDGLISGTSNIRPPLQHGGNAVERYRILSERIASVAVLARSAILRSHHLKAPPGIGCGRATGITPQRLGTRGNLNELLAHDSSRMCVPVPEIVNTEI